MVGGLAWGERQRESGGLSLSHSSDREPIRSRPPTVLKGHAITITAIYYSTLTDACGNDSCPGDGITSACRRLVATATSVRAARAHIAELEAGHVPTRPGDGRTTPSYSLEAFHPMDYRSRQDNERFYGREGAKEMIASVPRVRLPSKEPAMSNTIAKTLTPATLPREMTRCGPGVFSIHFYGEEAGNVCPWDGREADALLSDDMDEAYAAGSADEHGNLAAMEVRVLLVDAEGEAWQMSGAKDADSEEMSAGMIAMRRGAGTLADNLINLGNA